MIDVNGLTSDPQQTNVDLTGQLFAAGSFSPETDGGTKPSWSGNDDWPVRAERLNGPTLESGSRITFAGAYVTEGTWVSGDATNVRLSLAFSGVALDLHVQNAFISGKHEGDTMTNGTVAGYVTLADLQVAIDKIAGQISTQAYPGQPMHDVIVSALASAADISTQGGAGGTECDAVSIGMGFEAQKVATPSKVAAEAPPGVDPCATLGQDGSSDAGRD